MKMSTDQISRLFRNMALHIEGENVHNQDNLLVHNIIQETFREAAKIYCREDRLADPAWELGITIYEMCREIAEKVNKPAS